MRQRQVRVRAIKGKNMANLNNKGIAFKPNQKGVVLIEALIAVLLFSLGVLALAGLQASLVRNSTDARNRAEAVYLAQKKIGELWADPTGAQAGNYITATPIAAPGLPDGTIMVEQPTRVGQYQITIQWKSPNEPKPHKVVMVANMVENRN